MSSAEVRATTTAENPLCQRLQTKFSGRGIASEGIGARSAGENRSKNDNKYVNRAKAAANPFEDTARFVPASAKGSVAYSTPTAKFERVGASAARQSAAHTATMQQSAQRRVAAAEVTTPFASGAYAAAYARAAEIRRRAYDGSEARMSAQREAERRAAAKKHVTSPIAWFKALHSDVKTSARDEVKVDNVHVSKGIIIAIVLFAVVVMMIIFSFSQISQFKSEISDLESQRSALCEEIDKLSLSVDLKNDVREIERAATEDIGMVKSNQVESKYISLSEGERVEVISENADSAESDYGIFGTVMSAFGRNWDNLMDYIK